MEPWLDLLPWLPFVLFAAVVAFAFTHHRKRYQQWLDLGQALGLHPGEAPGDRGWLSPWPDFRGQERGFEVRLRTYATGSGKSQTRWTAVEVAVPGAIPTDLRVTREGWGTALAKALGGQDVETGDPSFDPAFRIRAGDADQARRLLQAEVRARLLEVPQFGELRLDPPLGPWLHDPRLAPLVDFLARAGEGPGEHATVRYVRQEVLTDPEQVRPALHAALALADAVRGLQPLP